MASYTVEDALDREALTKVQNKLAEFNAALAEARARRFEFTVANEPIQGQSDAFLNYNSKFDITGDLRAVATKRYAIAAPTPKAKPNESKDAVNN